LPGAAVECGPCGTCDPRYGCVGVVWSHCFSSPEVGASGLLDVTLAPDGEKTLAWRWRPTRGADRGVGHLGFPQVLTDYTFCVLDHSEVGFAARRRRRVVLALSIPPGGRCGRKQCWQGRRGGYLYSDPSGSAGGVNRLLITPGKTMSPAIAIAAHGPRLDVGPLPIQGEATAQLRNRDGACWDASYSGFVKIDDTRRFKGRAGRQPEDYDEGH